METKSANVYRTDNYSSFKYLNGNRDVDRKRVQAVIDSVKTVGYVLSPIVVNEKKEVIDGQARLKAFEELKIPVDYVTAVGAGINECIYLNIKSSKWTVADYIVSYAKLGDVSYSFLKNLYLAYVKPKIYQLDVVMDAVTCGRNSASVKEGRFECTEQEYTHAVEILDYMRPIQEVFRSNRMAGNRNFHLRGIRFLYDSGLVNMDRLRNQIMRLPNLLSAALDTEMALDNLEAIYNYGARGDRAYGFAAAYRMYKDNRKKIAGKK